MKPWLRQFLAVILLGITLVMLYRLSPYLLKENIFFEDDFIEYWTAGRLISEGDNPYSLERMRALQMQAGWQGFPAMMWTPPWTLPMVMPLKAFDYRLARLLWLIGQTALLLFCASFIWGFYQGPPGLRWVVWLVAFTFVPSLFVLKKAQMSIVMLLGIVFFLRFTQRQTWWLASLALLFITVKPHTLYLVALAFLFWTVQQRRWALLAGSASGIILATGIALLFNPLVLEHYWYAIQHYPPTSWVTPTIGGGLRHFLGFDKVWLQFVPVPFGVVWLSFYWYKKRETWKWSEELPLLVTVSVLTSAYGFTYDYIVLLLPILAVGAGIFQQNIRQTMILAIVSYLAIDVATLVANLCDLRMDYRYMWLAPALAGWYFMMVRRQRLALLNREQRPLQATGQTN